MSIELYLAFVAACIALALLPGPIVTLVIANGLRHGTRAALTNIAGVQTGVGIIIAIVAVGLTSLMATMGYWFDWVRLAGAAYLIWLGITSLRPRRGRAGPAATDAAGEESGPQLAEPPAGQPQGWRVYLNGLLSNLFNPKIGVFFVAFLPGFIPARTSAAAFSLVFGLWFIVETGAWLLTLAWMVARGVGWLRGPAAQRRVERVTAVVLIGFGLRLAAETR